MAPRQPKTNAVRLLEAAGVSCELRTYDWDESDLSAGTVADKVGMPYGQVFKTLVGHGDRTDVLIACVAADTALDLKALAKASGNKKVELVALKDLQRLTGYLRGGISPVGVKRPCPVYLDERAFDWPAISLSAGMRGCQMILDPRELGWIVDVHLCRIARPHDTEGTNYA